MGTVWQFRKLMAAALASLFFCSSEALSTEIEGVWSDSACSVGGSTKVISRGGIIDLFKINSNTVIQIILTEDIEFKSSKITANGNHPLFNQPVFIELPIKNGKILGEFEKCDALPFEYSWMIGEPIAVFLDSSQALDACKKGDDALCFEEIFGVIDVYKDGKISVAELSRFLRAIAFFGGYYSSDSTQVDLTHAIGTMALSSIASPLLASSIVSGSDYNADGLLGMDEVLIDRSANGIASSLGAVRTGTVDILSTMLRSLSSQVTNTAISNLLFQ